MVKLTHPSSTSRGHGTRWELRPWNLHSTLSTTIPRTHNQRFFVNSFQCILCFFGFDVIVFSFHSFQFVVVIAVTAVTITVVEVSLFFSRRFYQVVGDIGLVICTAIVIIGALCCCIVNTSFTFSSV